MELEDLPPRYREQAARQIEARQSRRRPAPQTPPAGMKFDSRGEYEYYMASILPGLQSGEIVKVTVHEKFVLLSEREYCGIKLPAAHFTPDFLVERADGSTEAVEIKSKFTRRQQRDYIYRRRLFIDLIAEPRGWKFTEIVTGDTAKEIKVWKERARKER